MSAKAAFIKGGAVLSAGNIAATACSFVRNVIIARMLSVEDVGVAATFAVTASLMEMASNLALDRLIIQAPDGDDPRLQATAQFFQFIRGVIGGVFLLLIAWPAAALFGIPDAAWAFRLLAIVPFLKGFSHLDVHRVQRRMRFGPSVAVSLGPQVVATVAAAPLALWTGDFRAVLWILLLQAFLATGISHALAERRYAWAWDRERVRRIIVFGWPLLINGALMYVIFQGDRAIVGAALTMEDLGVFATALGLTLMPTLIVCKVLRTLTFPTLSRLAGERERFEDALRRTRAGALACGVSVGVFLAVGGAACVGLVYGERYLGAAPLMLGLALQQALRIARTAPTNGSVALGVTTNPMLANFGRLAAIPVGGAALVLGHGLEALVLIGAAGELAALVISELRLRAVHASRSWPLALQLCVSLAAGLGAWFAFARLIVGMDALWQAALAAVGAALAGGVVLAAEVVVSRSGGAAGRGETMSAAGNGA